jgi:DNA-directed RNA polymerase specialized sigma54-like protein
MTVYETAINLLSGYEPIGLFSRNKRDGLFYLIKKQDTDFHKESIS